MLMYRKIPSFSSEHVIPLGKGISKADVVEIYQLLLSYVRNVAVLRNPELL